MKWVDTGYGFFELRDSRGYRLAGASYAASNAPKGTPINRDEAYRVTLLGNKLKAGAPTMEAAQLIAVHALEQRMARWAREIEALREENSKPPQN